MNLITKDTRYTKFVKCPVSLLTADIPSTAKIIYLLLLYRLSFAISKGQCDKYNYPYVVCSISEIAKELGIGKGTVCENINVLEKFDLLFRRHNGIGKAQHIYIHNPDDLSEDLSLLNSGSVFLNNSDNPNAVDKFVYKSVEKTVEKSVEKYDCQSDGSENPNSTVPIIRIDDSDNPNTTVRKNDTEPFGKSECIYTNDTDFNTISLYTNNTSSETYFEKREKEDKKENAEAEYPLRSAEYPTPYTLEQQELLRQYRILNNSHF